MKSLDSANTQSICLKTCSVCGDVLPATLEFFNKHVKGKGGLKSYCRVCLSIKRKISRDKNREEYNKKERERRTPYQRYLAMIYTTYSLREEKLRDLMDCQKGCCAICENSLVNPEWKKSDMHIDHEHSTGKVRGLLCGPCNWLVGMCKEDVDVLDKARRYLIRKEE